MREWAIFRVAIVVAWMSGCSEGHARSGSTAAATASASNVPEALSVTGAPSSPRVTFTGATRAASIVLAHEGTELWAIVADEDAHALALVPLGAAGDAVPSIALEGTPARVAVGRLFYATLRDRSRVVAYALHEDGSAEKVAEAVTASSPFGLALTPDGSTVLVTTAFGHTLEAFDADTLKPRFSAVIATEPRGIALSADGARAFVSHATGSTLSVVELASRGKVVREVSLDVRERRLDFGIPGNSWAAPVGPGMNHRGPPMAITFLRRATWGMELATIGDDVYVPEALVNPGDAFEPTGYGENVSSLRTHVPHVAHVSGAETLLTKHISGPEDRACFESDRRPQCTLPMDVATLGDALYVACAGGDFVQEHRVSEAYDEAPRCFEARRKQRRFGAGRGLRGLAIDATRKHAFAWSAFDRRVTELDLGGAATTPVRTIDVPRTTGSAADALASKGRELFFATDDPRISNDGRACASCHPDGRQDSLVWPTPKGKRQTPMLAGRVRDTAPYDWNGANPTLVLHIARTTKNLHGRGLADEDRAALAAYLESLPGPDREVVAEEPRFARGRTIFESSEAQCSSCHPKESAYTDRQAHALAKGGAAFDTPSRRFVGGTAPYFHDGRYASLEEVVEKCDGIMGQTKHLTAEQKADLVAFLGTL